MKEKQVRLISAHFTLNLLIHTSSTITYQTSIKQLLKFSIESNRFYTGENGKSNFEHSWQIPEKQIPEHKISSAPLLTNGAKSHMGVIKLGKSRVHPEEATDLNGKRVLDPGSEVILQWNRMFLFSCLVALFVDPLFFYLPSVQINGGSSCMLSDLNLGIVVTCLRTIADIFYMLHIFIKFRTAYVSPSSRVLGRGELVMDPEKIAKKYMKSDFFIDLVATLPLPQVFHYTCLL